MEQRANFLALCLLDALEDEEESDVHNILNKYQVDPSFVQQERGIAPLHFACGMPNPKLSLDITRTFLKVGADVNVRSDENMTPLHVAAMYGRVEIVKMLLQHGAQLDVFDDERKTPVLYAIEECHFEVVILMRDHIFVDKFKRKQCALKPPEQSLLSQTKFDHSLQQRAGAVPPLQLQHVSTPTRVSAASPVINKNLLQVASAEECDAQWTPNRLHYNYDVTSPYYINITHRRHKPQPKFPSANAATLEEPQENGTPLEEPSEMEAHNSSASADTATESINIFTLTEDNLRELTHKAPLAESSRNSLINTWREKVQRSRARASILQQYDDIEEMLEQVMAHDHLNFTNIELKSKTPPQDAIEVDSGACGSASHESFVVIDNGGGGVSGDIVDDTEYAQLPPARALPNMSLGQLIQQVAKAQLAESPEPPAPEPQLDSSYQTVPELTASPEGTKQQLQVPTVHNGSTECPAPHDASNFIRSPKSGEYYLQMTEAYVLTDDDNGLVFYETKLPINQGNKIALQRTPAARKELDTTFTSHSTNVTLPLDYETDALRAELTTLGVPPGPITKSTKRLYIKRLVKFKRKTLAMQEQQRQNAASETKFSVELHRTVRSDIAFKRISEYMQYETQSMSYFANNQQKKQMREGHLKQSFIYMLIDPRISCNLPGESAFLPKFDVWHRFLQSIFYVGKGKTTRPYSHLYEAMKTHSRMHNVQLNPAQNGKKVSIKKQPLNIDLFKSPPKKSCDSKKLDRILNIWGNGNGVVCLHVFHNIVPTDAYTREASMIDALSLQHLTNIKRGDYYGPAQSWTMKEKKYLGIALLYKAMQIYLAEGESQLSPSDLI